MNKCITCNSELKSFGTTDDVINIIYTLKLRSYLVLLYYIVEEKSIQDMRKNFSVTHERVLQYLKKAFNEVIQKCKVAGIDITDDEIKTIIWNNKEKLKGIKLETITRFVVCQDFVKKREYEPIQPLILFAKTEIKNPESIEILDLSIRSRNCLIAGGITTIQQLLDKSPSDLLCIKNLGRKALNEIYDALNHVTGFKSPDIKITTIN